MVLVPEVKVWVTDPVKPPLAMLIVVEIGKALISEIVIVPVCPPVALAIKTPV